MYFLVSPFRDQLLFVTIIITTLVNFVAAVFIAARVLYFRRYKKTVGLERNNQYTTVIDICVESAALIILFTVLFIVLTVTEHFSASFIFRQSLVHINVRVHNLLHSCKNSNLMFV